MAELFNSTNKLPDNPYPERSHLLTEGIIDLTAASYTASGSGYASTDYVDITQFVKFGSREKGFGPAVLESKVWLTQKGGSISMINDVASPLPITLFSGSTLLRQTYFEIQNIYDIDLDLSTSEIQIYDYRSALPTRTQSFSYKIYATIYQFTDT